MPSLFAGFPSTPCVLESDLGDSLECDVPDVLIVLEVVEAFDLFAANRDVVES